MTAQRQTKTHTVLTQPHITWTHEGVNMAENIMDGEPHNCEVRTTEANTVRTGLQATPLENPQIILFTDGCCFKAEKGLASAYAVVRGTETGFEVLEAETIEGKQSAQRAEICARVRALQQTEGLTTNIYTDSAYASTVVHCSLAEWKINNYQTAGGQEVRHLEDILSLEKALQLPSALAVIKCKAHTNLSDFVSVGSQHTDSAAKKAAGYDPLLKETENQYQMVVCPIQELKEIDIMNWQEKASPEEKSGWLQKGATKNKFGVWEKDHKPAFAHHQIERIDQRSTRTSTFGSERGHMQTGKTLVVPLPQRNL